jgi:hypothetical protein
MTNAVLEKCVPVRVHDVSAGGCLLETKTFLPIGTLGVLDMEFEGARRIEWFRICRLHSTGGRSGAHLSGAEFLPLTAAGNDSLRGAVTRMRPVATA